MVVRNPWTGRGIGYRTCFAPGPPWPLSDQTAEGTPVTGLIEAGASERIKRHLTRDVRDPVRAQPTTSRSVNAPSHLYP